jgi:hypothetical protein
MKLLILFRILKLQSLKNYFIDLERFNNRMTHKFIKIKYHIIIKIILSSTKLDHFLANKTLKTDIKILNKILILN